MLACCAVFTSWAVSGYFFWNGTDAAFRHPDEWCSVAFSDEAQSDCYEAIRMMLQANIEDGRLGELLHEVGRCVERRLRHWAVGRLRTAPRGCQKHPLSLRCP